MGEGGEIIRALPETTIASLCLVASHIPSSMMRRGDNLGYFRRDAGALNACW